MKKRTSIPLSIVILLSLAAFTATGQNTSKKSVMADTGVVFLGTGQVLRITVNGASGNDTITLRLSQTQYASTPGCMPRTMCPLETSSQTTSPPFTQLPGKASVTDLVLDPFNTAVRAAVFSNRPSVTVAAQIINSLTGEVISRVIMANTEGDFH
jgi:hypothetical protein